MFDIFIGCVLLVAVCSMISAALIVALSYRHEDADSTYYDNSIKH